VHDAVDDAEADGLELGAGAGLLEDEAQGLLGGERY
jgi:hypothetical protein